VREHEAREGEIVIGGERLREALVVTGQTPEARGPCVSLGYVDQGYTGAEPAEAAAAHGIRLEVIKHTEGCHC